MTASDGSGVLHLRTGDAGTLLLARVDPPDRPAQANLPGLREALTESEAAIVGGERHTPLHISKRRVVLRAADLVRDGDGGYSLGRFSLIASREALTLVGPPDLPALRRFMESHPEGSLVEDGVAGLLFDLYAQLAERYHAASEVMVDAAEHVAQRVLVGPAKGLAHETFRVRRDAYAVRLAVTRARAAFAVLVHEFPEDWSDRTGALFREVADRLEPIHEDVENVRESLGETVEAYSSVQSNDINEVMKLFTLISLLFLPPTLIASIYGMNFRIPEYHWPQGYAYSLGLMAVLTGVLVLYVRWRRWLR